MRAIAIDRGFHFILLGALGVLVFFIASHQHELQQHFYRVLADIQGGVGGGPVQSGRTGVIHDLDKLFTLRSTTLHLLGAALFVYAAMEALEAIGLWNQHRWAEYLTFIATALFLPLECFELSKKLSVLRLVALVVNLAIVIYLIWAKRLFGVRGGIAAERAERKGETGWEALERSAPGVGQP